MALHTLAPNFCSRFLLAVFILCIVTMDTMQYNVRTKRVDLLLETGDKKLPPRVHQFDKEPRDSGYNPRKKLDKINEKRVRTKRIDYEDEDVFKKQKIDKHSRESRKFLESSKTSRKPPLTYEQISSKSNPTVQVKIKTTESLTIASPIDPTVSPTITPSTEYSTDPNIGTISTETELHNETITHDTTITNGKVSTTHPPPTTQYSTDRNTETIPTTSTEFQDQTIGVKDPVSGINEKHNQTNTEYMSTTQNTNPSNVDLPYVVLRKKPTSDDKKVKDNDINNLQQSLFGYCSGQTMKQTFTANGCENVTINTLVCGGVCQAPVQSFTDLHDIEEAFGTCKYCGPLEYTEKLIFMQCYKGIEKRRRWKIEVRKIYVPKRCGCIKESCYKLNKVNGEGDWDV